MTGNTKGDAFSYRPKREHAPRIADLVAATGHKKARFLDLALEAMLPELEKKFSADLAEYHERQRRAATLNDAPAAVSRVEPLTAVDYRHPMPRPTSSSKETIGKTLKQSVKAAVNRKLAKAAKSHPIA